MRVVMRTDSSAVIGSGHVMRCLALAKELHDRGAEITFVCRDLPGNMVSYILKQEGIQAVLLPASDGLIFAGSAGGHKQWLGTDWGSDASQTSAAIAGLPEMPEWMVVDHYALDSEWERSMRPRVRKIFAIDDLADRSHDCDMVLDQNLYPYLETRYDDLVPKPCRKFLGPRFALLRPEFHEARLRMSARKGKVRRALVFFGGVDATNETGKTIEAWESLGPTNLSMDVIVGGSNPFRESIQEQCHRHPQLSFHVQVSNMAEWMMKTDLAIGAGGITTWERCCLSLPTLCITVAENQKLAARTAAELGLHRYLGHYTEVGSHDLAWAIRESLMDTADLAAMAKKAGAAVDGLGAPRIAEMMFEG